MSKTKAALEAALPFLVYLSDDEELDPKVEAVLMLYTNSTRDLIKDALREIENAESD